MSGSPALRFAGLALVLAALAAACGGGSGSSTGTTGSTSSGGSPSSAQTAVCTASADVAKQLDGLAGMTASTATLSGISASVDAIKGDLQTIKAAAPTLSANRKAQVEHAVATFQAEIQAIAPQILVTLSAGETADQLQASVSKLKKAFEDSLGGLGCSG